MPLVKPALYALIQKKVSSKMKAIADIDPLQQKDPTGFMQLCLAVATGIADGTPTISFTTTDSGFGSAPPVPGVGSGVGITVNDQAMSQSMYTKVRNLSIEAFGKDNTATDPWPPTEKNSGMYLRALTDGIAESVKEHFATAWTLSSSHPFVYAGSSVISNGGFSGLNANLIKNLTVTAGTEMKGEFWPKLAKAIADGYVDGVHNHSTGSITIIGVCVPSIVQVCLIPMSGMAGSGSAA